MAHRIGMVWQELAGVPGFGLAALVVCCAGPSALDTRSDRLASAIQYEIWVTPVSPVLCQWGRVQMTAEARDSSGHPVAPDAPFVWASSDPEAASVSPSGLVSAVAQYGGVTTVTASMGVSNGSTRVRVKRCVCRTVQQC